MYCKYVHLVCVWSLYIYFYISPIYCSWAFWRGFLIILILLFVFLLCFVMFVSYVQYIYIYIRIFSPLNSFRDLIVWYYFYRYFQSVLPFHFFIFSTFQIAFHCFLSFNCLCWWIVNFIVVLMSIMCLFLDLF